MRTWSWRGIRDNGSKKNKTTRIRRTHRCAPFCASTALLRGAAGWSNDFSAPRPLPVILGSVNNQFHRRDGGQFALWLGATTAVYLTYSREEQQRHSAQILMDMGPRPFGLGL